MTLLVARRKVANGAYTMEIPALLAATATAPLEHALSTARLTAKPRADHGAPVPTAPWAGAQRLEAHALPMTRPAVRRKMANGALIPAVPPADIVTVYPELAR